MSIRNRWYALKMFGALAVGCGGSASGVRPDEARLTVDRLYPLRPGSVWTYDVETGQGLPTLAITRVLESEGNRVKVSSGADPVIYERREQGLFRPDRNAYVLKEPLEQGESWDAGQGATATVTDLNKSVSTPAGDFRGCVEVVETGGATPKEVRTVFCPDVGPVELESSMQMDVSGQVARVLARLRGYDFSGALGAE